MNLERIQEEIRSQKLDGWLFFDHHQRDPLAYRVLGLPTNRVPTRRWYYFIPAQGEPGGLEHRIERGMLAALPGEKTPYASWTEQIAGLRNRCGGAAASRCNTRHSVPSRTLRWWMPARWSWCAAQAWRWRARRS